MKKNKVHVIDDKCHEAVRNNLHAEHKRVHKFTKVVSAWTKYVTDHTSCQNAQGCKAVKCNLPSEHNRMSSRMLQVDKEKSKVHVTDITSRQNAQCCKAVKTNLPSEHRKMHKFTNVSSGETEKQSSCH